MHRAQRNSLSSVLAVATVALVLDSTSAGRATAVPQSGRASQVTVRVYGANGASIPRAQLQTQDLPDGSAAGVFPLNSAYEPIPFGVAAVSEGEVTLSDPVPSPLIVHFFPSVEGFGQVKVYADNGGAGYTVPGSGPWKIDLPLEAARSRILKVEQLVRNNPSVSFRSEMTGRLNSAKGHLALAAPEGASAKAASNPGEVYRSLADGLWAGEMAVLDVARATISRTGRRNDFKFGIFTEGSEEWTDAQKLQFASVFNFVTIPTFFLVSYEPVSGNPQPEATLKTLAWVQALGFDAKGHPLVYPLDKALPSWLQGRDYSQLEAAFVNRIRREVSQYRGRIKTWDVLNEGNNSNRAYSQDQILRLARAASQTVKDTDPSATRLMNVNMPTGDFVASPEFSPSVAQGKIQHPVRYLKSLVSGGVDFDAIGMELYYPALDLMEISNLIDRYAAIGKPIYITEVGVSSAMGIDRQSNMFASVDLTTPLGQWHRPWDEATQADWIEQFYTLAYSKASIRGITYANAVDQFWPFGGLFRRDKSPKQSFGRLQQLLQSWGFRGASR